MKRRSLSRKTTTLTRRKWTMVAMKVYWYCCSSRKGSSRTWTASAEEEACLRPSPLTSVPAVSSSSNHSHSYFQEACLMKIQLVSQKLLTHRSQLADRLWGRSSYLPKQPLASLKVVGLLNLKGSSAQLQPRLINLGPGMLGGCPFEKQEPFVVDALHLLLGSD